MAWGVLNRTDFDGICLSVHQVIFNRGKFQLIIIAILLFPRLGFAKIEDQTFSPSQPPCYAYVAEIFQQAIRMAAEEQQGISTANLTVAELQKRAETRAAVRSVTAFADEVRDQRATKTKYLNAVWKDWLAMFEDHRAQYDDFLMRGEVAFATRADAIRLLQENIHDYLQLQLYPLLSKFSAYTQALKSPPSTLNLDLAQDPDEDFETSAAAEKSAQLLTARDELNIQLRIYRDSIRGLYGRIKSIQTNARVSEDHFLNGERENIAAEIAEAKKNLVRIREALQKYEQDLHQLFAFIRHETVIGDSLAKIEA